MNIDNWQAAILIGIGATLLMDLWIVIQKYCLNIPSLSFCLIGRWISYLPSGIFFHQQITKTPKHSSECVTGWVAHYAIGIIFAFILVILNQDWLINPNLYVALAFGVMTLTVPFFILQPALGLGIAASKTSQPAKARLKSLLTHSVFALGLYLSTLGLQGLIIN